MLKPSDCFEDLVKVYNNMPPLSQQINSNIALFRDGIGCAWEDPANVGTWIIEIRLNRNGVKSDKDKEGNERYQQVKDEEINAIFFALIVMCLTQENKQVNGLYVKTKKECIIMQLWVNNEFAADTFKKVQDYLKSLGIEKGIAKY